MTAGLFLKMMSVSCRKRLHYLDRYLDKVALATVADIMPLTGENRIIAKKGLEFLNKTRNLGLIRLFGLLGITPGSITDEDIAWKLAPALNAPGRMQRSSLVIDLLFARKPEEIDKAASEIISLNAKRKEKSAKNYGVLSALVEKQADIEKDRIIVLTTDEVEHGVTGLIANRIRDNYSRPVIVFIEEDGMGVGSARSLAGIDIIKLIGRCSHLLEKFGGHSQAAGLSIKPENIDRFREEINRAAADLTEESFTEVISIDMKLDVDEADFDMLSDLDMMGPFGMGNPKPVFCASSFDGVESSSFGEAGAHLKMLVSRRGKKIEAVGWGLGSLSSLIGKAGASVEIAYCLEKNVWLKKISMRLNIKDIHIN